MKCIVTGGAGFIGSHLVDYLLDKNLQVVVIDNLSTGRYKNIEHNLNKPNFKYYNLDISQYENIEPLFKNVDWVFHLAALADIVPSIQNPLKYHKSNVAGTISVLEASRKYNVKRFIYSASSTCYGIPDVTPTPETADIRVEYPYAVTKNIAEQYVLNWHKIYDLPVLSLRYFNVYGPRARTTGTYGAVFGVFLAQKIHGKPFTVVGDGTQTRDFTYVTDIIEANYLAAKLDISGEAINIGSGGTYSINKLVELLGGEKIHIPKRPGEPDITYADITKAKKLLKWQPKIKFEDGVKKMIEYIDYWKDAPIWTPEMIDDATKDWFKYLS